ncbi:hypothetical protein ACRN9A_07010 [Shewanella frigidimarina]|uniref:hypothetical protein n=1 Tax=Shewanella frigidimarina TaxID=56812 RepID=UPI003D792CA1
MSESVEKILQAPIQIEFTDSVKKIRQNLMITSFIALFITLGGVSIDPSSTMFGLKFNGLDDSLLHKGLLILILYFLVHFIWCAYESLQEWEVRVTGAKEAFIRADEMDIDESVKPPYPSDPRNATLYFWWSTQAKRIGSLKEHLTNINQRIESMESVIHQMNEKGASLSYSDLNISTQVQPLKIDINRAKSSITRIEQVLDGNQLLVSMKTFDRRYKYFLMSQNIRWFVIDFFGPIILSSVSLLCLLNRGVIVP